MRLSNKEIESIKTVIKNFFGENSTVYLFGSRVDNQKKGGDIDLYIETDQRNEILKRKLNVLNALEKVLGERKIDIVVNNFKVDKYIYKIARSEGIQL